MWNWPFLHVLAEITACYRPNCNVWQCSYLVTVMKHFPALGTTFIFCSSSNYQFKEKKESKFLLIFIPEIEQLHCFVLLLLVGKIHVNFEHLSTSTSCKYIIMPSLPARFCNYKLSPS